MFEKVQQWQTKRTITKAVKDALAHDQGLAAKGWPISAATTTADLGRIADEVRTWFLAQLPETAMPHGIHFYTAYLGFAHMDGDQRTYLGKLPFPDFQRHESLARLDHIHEAICALDLSPYPTVTVLEVYFFSFGDMIKPVLDAAARP